MKGILVIVGRSGSGKSTIAKELSLYYKQPLLTFSKMGRELARKKGLSNLKEYYVSANEKEFRDELGQHLMEEISMGLQKSNFVIIDDLIYDKVVLMIRKKFLNVLIFNIEVPYEIRVKRIADRLSVTIKEAQKVEKEKADLKEAIGIENVLKNCEYILDGRKSIQELIEEFIGLVEKRNWKISS